MNYTETNTIFEITTLQQETAFKEYEEQEETYFDFPTFYKFWCLENGHFNDL